MVYRFGSYKINPDGTMDLKISRDSIRNDVLEEYRNKSRILIDLQPVTIDYDCVSRNRDALFETIIALRNDRQLAHMPLAGAEKFLDDAINRMNQHVNNFLASTRAFIDHAKTRLERRFGGNSPEVSAFKQDTSCLFDSHFSYRFLYSLRDYGTHCDLPVMNANVGAAYDEAGSFRSEVAFMVDRDRILSEFNLKRRVRQDVKLQEPMINLIPLIEEQAEWNRQLFKGMLERQKDNLLESHKYMNILRGILQKNFEVAPDEVPVIWEGSGFPSEGVQRIELIPFAHVERMVRLLMSRGPTSALEGRKSQG
jgi:hypothetical protein